VESPPSSAASWSKAQEVADKYGAARHHRTSTSAGPPDVDAVILCTPTQMHAAQSIAA
jgi:2-hydroxy-4-carboxymuconate semialdehyde hemiacetal dehydrogenase